MKVDERVSAWIYLGKLLDQIDWSTPIKHAQAENPWFTADSIQLAIQGIQHLLDENSLNRWLQPYRLHPKTPKIVGIVAAGNIPMVGLHDLLCILLSGHIASIKLSSQDKVLLPYLLKHLVEIEPRFEQDFKFVERLSHLDAVIATGTDNTSRYFEHYFGKYPNIIRKNRVSVAVLNGNESASQLEALGKDIFYYYGLGCRNVAKLILPHDFSIERLYKAFEVFSNWGSHHKYKNNYDYHKSILLINGDDHLDNGFLLLRETEELASPTSILYFHRYHDPEEVQVYLANHQNKIQCIVGENQQTPLGQSQFPEPWDYADRVDTLDFLDHLTPVK